MISVISARILGGTSYLRDVWVSREKHFITDLILCLWNFVPFLCYDVKEQIKDPGLASFVACLVQILRRLTYPNTKLLVLR